MRSAKPTSVRLGPNYFSYKFSLTTSLRLAKFEFSFLAYLDQYGAPVETKNSWVEGYHEIEEQLNDNRTKLRVNKMKFPPILGLAGAAHLYKQFHENKPWNWTGWIPLQNQFYHKKKYINYRLVFSGTVKLLQFFFKFTIIITMPL